MAYGNCSVDWSINFYQPTYDRKPEVEGFYNPEPDHSIRPAKFLEHFNFDYKIKGYNPNSKHFHFNIESMLKLIVFKRLMKIRWDTVLAERLKNNVHGCKDLLGFNERTPTQPTLNMFFNKIMGVDGHWSLFEKLLIRLKDEMDSKGIKFGERIGIDSTPLPVMKKDETGEVNAHYYKEFGIFKMIKIHIVTCLDTGIPIAITFSRANYYDGHSLIPLLRKLTLMGFNIKEIHGDGSYDTFVNWAISSVVFGTDCYFNLSKRSIYRREGTIPKIKRRYQRYHNEPKWIPTDDERSMMIYLIRKGNFEHVGGYFRNKLWRIWRYHKDEYKKIIGERNKVENLHSILKEQLLFEKNIDGKGWNKIKIYTLQFMITMVTVALIRAENGVKEGFNKVSDGVFC